MKRHSMRRSLAFLPGYPVEATQLQRFDGPRYVPFGGLIGF